MRTRLEPTRASEDPVVELAATLHDLRAWLDSLIDSCDPTAASSACLAQLRHYLLVDLMPEAVTDPWSAAPAELAVVTGEVALLADRHPTLTSTRPCCEHAKAA